MTRAHVTGTALREITVRDYKRNAERAGIPADMRLIEAVAIADCNTYDAVMRDAAPARAPVADPPAEAARADELDRLAAEQQATILRDTHRIVKRTIPTIHAMPKRGSKWDHAVGRCARIVSGATPNADRRAGIATCEMPKLAWELWRIHAWLVTRYVPPRIGDEINPFYGITDADFVRIHRRLVEDICDKSTGQLGPWWTPK